MDYITVFGIVGSILSLTANIPQVIAVRNSNSTEDLHPLTVFIHILSSVTWSLYGFFIEAYVLGVESAIVGILNVLIMAAIIRDKYFCDIERK